MRFPTLSQSNQSMDAITKQLEHVQHLQTQIATGKKIQLASEDPALANRIKDVDTRISRLQGFELNGILAENRTALIAERMQEAMNVTARVEELMIQAQNDTLNNKDRALIAEELRGSLQSMLNCANTQDKEGEYIFSGMNINQPAFIQDGNQYRYQGSQEGTLLPIGENRLMLYGDSGFQLFDGIKLGNGTFSVSADSTNNTGTGVISAGNLTSSSNYVRDDYNIILVMNASGHLAYQLIGTASGQLIPKPPLTTPDDAPVYVAGQTIEFNGMSVQLNGKPNENDVFSITPSKTDNVLNVMQQLIDTLSNPIYSDKDKADFHQQMSEQTASFKQVSNHIQTNLVDIGYREKMIDEQLTWNKDHLMVAQIMSSKLSDVDLGQAISELTQRLTTLEVTQQTYLKIQETYMDLLSR